MERLTLPVNSAVKAENGATISAKVLDIKRPKPSDVAQHEAAHVVAARRIKMATIIPNGNALGATYPEVMTPKAAAAAAAMGHDGIGWDKFLTENYLGVDFESAKASARAELSGQSEEMEEVATILEERKTIGQSDVEEAKTNVNKRRRGIYPVEVQIGTPEGKIVYFNTESENSQVDITTDLIFTQQQAA